MKKAFLLLTAVMTVTGIVWFNASASSGPSIDVTIYSEFFTDAKAGAHVPAGIFTADENLEQLACETTARPGYVLCQIPESYAGQQQLPIQLTKNGVMYMSLVNIPE